MKKELNILDIKGNTVETIALDESLVEYKTSNTLFGIYLRAVAHNKRQGTSSVKTRAEVSGSGAKPWKQKGLGRARVGSKRNPLWRHGGIVHGPKPKSWKLSTTASIRGSALLASIAKKIEKNTFYIVKNLDLDKPKSKDGAKIMKDLNLNTSTLFVTNLPAKNLIMGFSNIPQVKVTALCELSAYDVLKFQSLVLSQEVYEVLRDKYGN